MMRRFRVVDGDGKVDGDRATVRYDIPGRGPNWMVDVPRTVVERWPGFEWEPDGPEAA